MNKKKRICVLETKIVRLEFDLANAERIANRLEQLINTRVETTPIFRDEKLYLMIGGKWISLKAMEEDPGPYKGRLITSEYIYNIEKRLKKLEMP